MPYRILCNDVKREGVKASAAIVSGLLCYVALHKIRYGIVMVFLSLTLNDPVNRWTNIIVAILFFVFNLIGLPIYPSAYDKFLIIVGLVFNALTVWYAWKWV